jgi:predicted ATPase
VITSIHLHNFKCWADERVPLGTLTLVTGLNGAGKSTLLQSLLVLRQSSEQGLLAEGRLAINGELVTLGTGRDVFCEDAEDDSLALGLRWHDGQEATWSFRYDGTADVLEADPKAVLSVPVEVVSDTSIVTPTPLVHSPFGRDFFHLAAERVGPRVSAEVSEFRVRVRREMGSRGELAAHFLAVHGRDPVGLRALQHPDAVSDSLVDQVEAWLGEVSPGARLHIGEHRDLDAVQIRYSFAGPAGGTNEYRATNVGFGLSYTLPILVAALAARPGALVVVENPEAHLHPRGQVRLAGLLSTAAAQGVQVLIETHSDHVLNGVRLAVHAGTLSPNDTRIHFFERRTTPERSYAARLSPVIDADGRLDPWPPGFFDEMEIALDQLLQPRKERS